MFLHIGKDRLLDINDVVGIFDIENTTTGKNTSRLLENATREDRVVNVTFDLPKSFIVTVEGGIERVYVCGLSAATLRRRVLKTVGAPTGQTRLQFLS